MCIRDRESIGEPNFFVAYAEPSATRLPEWLGDAPRSWAASAGSRLLLEKNGRRRDVEPVSYTHLDVYKRQMMASS